MKTDFKKILNEAGLKNTIPRLRILQILFEIKHPETVEGIHKKLKKNKIDLVTLYRTLASFEKIHLVRRIDLHKDSICYELNINHHHHIICKDCGVVEDFELCDMTDLTKKIIAKASKFKNIQDHSLELFGVCNACMKN